MRIACVDKNASDRAKLQKFIDDAYAECRHSIGHISFIQTYPVTKDELLLSKAPDAVIVGPSYTIEDTYAVCREIRDTFPQVPILLLLDPSIYSLRTLRRFEKICTDIFSSAEPVVRLVHSLSSYDGASRQKKGGKVIVVTGVKGGVGATSVTSALAHSAEALGKTAVVVDLSAVSAFIQYMATKRWQSPDYSALLVDGLSPDNVIVQRCLTTAPNGITVLLPPSGGSEIRELWLRDRQKFEVTLSIVEILKDLFDVVLLDVAGAEGILVFALSSKAHARLLVTSNDPASVHLLNASLSRVAELPGNAQVQVLINSLHDRGLTKEDILDFLYINEHFREEMCLLEPIPYDARGKNWIGTGNTFYTECGTSAQSIFDDALSTLLLSPDELEKRKPVKESLFTGLKRLTSQTLKKRIRFADKLPAPRSQANSSPAKLPLLRPVVANPETQAARSSELPSMVNDRIVFTGPESIVDSGYRPAAGESSIPPEAPAESTYLYQSPKLVSNE